jgi:hypothetical protein
VGRRTWGGVHWGGVRLRKGVYKDQSERHARECETGPGIGDIRLRGGEGVPGTVADTVDF